MPVEILGLQDFRTTETERRDRIRAESSLPVLRCQHNENVMGML
jgi:hypothetical protein